MFTETKEMSAAQEIGTRYKEAATCFNLGLVYEQQGRLAEAAAMMQAAADLYTQINSMAHAVQARNALARVRARLNTDEITFG